jgi:hypothetical protein
MTGEFHPLVKRLLDGELSLHDLPPELRAQGEEAMRLLAAVDREAVTLPAALDARVMERVRRRAASPVRRAWRWLGRPREVRLRVRLWPWGLGGAALAAAAAVALLLGGGREAPGTGGTGGTGGDAAGAAAHRDSGLVRFVLYAPGAKRVAVAGTFNRWTAVPLLPAGTSGVWAATLALPVGQHQYAFVVDGERWVADPAAPAVNDGFGRQNSVLAVTARGGRTL